MPSLLRHTLVVQPSALSTSWPGWVPWVGGHVIGPVPDRARVVVTLGDGSAPLWTASTELRPAGAGAMVPFVVTDHDLDHLLTVAGRLQLTIALRDGDRDEVLHEAPLEIGVHRGDGWREWFLAEAERTSLASLWFERDDIDAPTLGVTTWCEGEPGEVRAMLFHDGVRVRPGGMDEGAMVATWGRSVTSQRGNVTHSEISLEFRRVRAWATTPDPTWHVLDRAPGAYEVKLLRNGLLDLVVPFEVDDDGQVVAPGALDVDPHHRVVMAVPVVRRHRPPGIVPPAGTSSIEALYDGWTPPAAAGRRGLSVDLLAALSATAARAVQVDAWYHDTLADGGEGPGFLLSCRSAEHRVRAVLAALDPLVTRVGAEWEVELDDGTTAALGALASRMTWIGERAAHWRRRADEVAAARLAPFRAVLVNDKLALFDEHPLPEQRWFTSGGRPLRTPEELVAADTWWMVDEGGPSPLALRWNLVGWRFDDTQRIRERLGATGFGADAPLSAFG